jgi:Right handed beta helix region/Fibronectin type III domain/Kelch motif
MDQARIVISHLRGAILVALVISAVAAGPTQAQSDLAGAINANQWLCSTGDTGAGCATTDIPPMPTGESSAASATAPCRKSTDTCIYVLGNGRTVQAFDVATNTWTSSDTGGACADAAALDCLPGNISGSFAAAVDSCPLSADTCIYVMGGTLAYAQGVTSAMDAYDTRTNTWTSSNTGGFCANSAVLPCMPTPRNNLAAVTATCPASNDRCVYALGGNDLNGAPLRTVEAYDPTTDRWTSSDTGGTCANVALACMPTARAGLLAASSPCPRSQEYCVYAIGGLTSGSNQTVEAYSPVSNTWVSSDTGGGCANASVVACLPSPDYSAGAVDAPCPVSADTCLYVVGGSAGMMPVWTNEAYDPSNNSWTSSDSGGSCANSAAIACLPTARYGDSVSEAPCPKMTASCIYVVGGTGASSSAPLTAVEAYDARPITDIQLFVSPNGSDSNPGTYFSPYRDLTYAQDVVRGQNTNMTSNIDVYLENGTYRLTQPLDFGPQDSGTDGYDVTWSGAPGEDAIVSGAEQVTGWKLSDGSKNIWSASVPTDLQTRQIYVNGMRAWLASSAIPVGLAKNPKGYKARSPVMARWRNPSAIEFVYTGQVGLMAEPICPIASIKKRAITMAQPCWSNSINRGRNLVGYGRVQSPTYVENAYEALRQPGQFYLDQHRHLLYYIPRPGEDMNRADVEAAALQTLVSGSGSPRATIHNIAFSNLQFSYATWLQPNTPNGFSEIQANYTITGKGAYATQGLCHVTRHGTCPYGAWTKEPGNIQFSYDRNISFLNDRFVHLGAAALNLDNGSQDDTIASSVFTDVSGNGIEIGNVNTPEARGAGQTRGIDVSDNHLYGLPVEYHGGVAILVGYAADCTISHNQIDHTSYAAISMGWGGWLDKDSLPPVANNSRNNVVSDNLIFDYMETLADGGAIYTQGITGTSMTNGERITGNVIHDQLDWGYALHSDDGATFVTYAHNVLYDNGYDFGSNHQDFRPGHHGTDAPVALTGNYWQQGYPNSSNKPLKIVARGNNLITGAQDAPAALVASAGIEPRSRSVLSWRPAGESLPAPPDLLDVLYAFRSKAYITWHPSVTQGNTPVDSYTVTSCRVNGRGPCVGAGAPPVTISASDFDRFGYAVVSGLRNGSGYSLQVTASNQDGSSLASIATGPFTPAGHGNGLPSRPKGMAVQAGRHAVRVLWYPPANSYSKPPLSYVVTTSSGQKYTVSGLQDMMANLDGARVLQVFGGLQSGRKYRFSVAAVTPGGVGPPAESAWTAPS